MRPRTAVQYLIERLVLSGGRGQGYEFRLFLRTGIPAHLMKDIFYLHNI